MMEPRKIPNFFVTHFCENAHLGILNLTHFGKNICLANFLPKLLKHAIKACFNVFRKNVNPRTWGFFEVPIRSLVLLVIMLLFVSCKEVIMHNLDEVQANKVSIILHGYNIEAEKIKSGNNWNIQVNSDQTFSALQILDKNRFLKRLSSKPKTPKGSLMVSREERQRVLERELAFNLEETLESMPEILEARIHFYFKQQNDLELIPQSSQRTASILLITDNRNKPDTLKEPVTKLISGATGIEESAISIIIAKETAISPEKLQSASHSITGSASDVVLTPRIFLIGIPSLILFLGVSFVLRKRFRRLRKAEVEPEIEATPEKDSILKHTVTENKEKDDVIYTTGSEVNTRPPGVGDLKAFRYMNQELF